MENVATYSEARSEYTKQMASLIVPGLFTWFQNLWLRNASDKQRSLSLFQGECEEVARWNQDRINDEVRALIERSSCDYMEELMAAVFIAHTKILTAVRLSTKQKKLSITVPKLDHFLHRVFKESARCFWKTPFLFMESGSVVERQKNFLQAEQLLTDAIGTAVRGMLPVKQILKDYMEEGEEVDDVPSVEITEVKPVETPAAVVPAPVTPVTPVTPEIVSIDTEPSVSFSEHVSDFDEARGEPEMIPMANEEESSDALKIDESSTTALTEYDIEDLEAPSPSPKLKEKTIQEETIQEEDVVVLE
jgi:hypothetical protein